MKRYIRSSKSRNVVHVTIKLGTHSNTLGKYYFVFPERYGDIVPNKIWNQLSVSNKNATHFTSVTEAEDWLQENVADVYNVEIVVD